MEQIGLGEIVILFTLLLNVCGIVWGAAKIDAAVKGLQKGLYSLGKVVDDHDEKLHLHETRITVLEKVS